MLKLHPEVAVILVNNENSYHVAILSQIWLQRSWFFKFKPITKQNWPKQPCWISKWNVNHINVEVYLSNISTKFGFDSAIDLWEIAWNVIPDFLYHLTNVFTNCSMNFDQLVFKLLEVTLVLVRRKGSYC